MAKKHKTNKSQAIRDYFKANRKASAKEVTEALGKQGIVVTEGLVYNIKGKIRGRKRRRIATASIQARGGKSGTIDAIKLIQEVKTLAEKAGGMKRLKELLEILG